MARSGHGGTLDPKAEVVLVSAYGPPAEQRLHISARLPVFVGLAVALASALLVGGARSASRAQGLIAFTRSDGIYVTRSDGSGVRVLRRGGIATYAGPLAWSPDGRKLAFVSLAPGHVAAGLSGEIWVMNADGSHPVLLARNGYSPTWSPDGSRIAFTRGLPKMGVSDVWVMKADGSNQQRLAKTRLSEVYVDWSPAGGRLALSGGNPYIPDVYVMSTNGGNRRNLTPGRLLGSEPQWAPDDHRIVLAGAGRNSGICVVNANGTGWTRLTAKHGVWDHTPTWSPDGSQIAFVRHAQESKSSEIYVMNAGGAGVTRLTHNQVGEGSLAWQPEIAP